MDKTVAEPLLPPDEEAPQHSHRKKKDSDEEYWASELDTKKSGLLKSGASRVAKYIQSKFEPYYMLITAFFSLIDIVADVALVVTFYSNRQYLYANLSLGIIIVSACVVTLFEWYSDERPKAKYVVLNLLHVRVVWAALRAGLHKIFGWFTPERDDGVDLAIRVRDLKTWEAFFESGPQLLLQTYIVIDGLRNREDGDPNLQFQSLASILTSAISLSLSALTFEVEMYSVGFEPPPLAQAGIVLYHFCSVLFLAFSLSFFAVCHREFVILLTLLSFFIGVAIFYGVTIYKYKQQKKEEKAARERAEGIERASSGLEIMTDAATEFVEGVTAFTILVKDSRLWGYPLFGFYTSSLIHVKHRLALNIMVMKNLLVAIIACAASLLDTRCASTNKESILFTTDQETQGLIICTIVFWVVSVLVGAIIKLYFSVMIRKIRIEQEQADQEAQAKAEKKQRREERKKKKAAVDEEGAATSDQPTPAPNADQPG